MKQHKLRTMIIQLFLLCVLAFWEGHAQTSAGPTFANCLNAVRTTTCNPVDEFRTIDGTCNNRRNRLLGSIKQPLLRVVGEDYVDGFDIPRSLNGTAPVSSANLVSEELFNVENTNQGTGELSVLFMTFGQFLDHDISLSPHADCPISNCESPQAFIYPCFPIPDQLGRSNCTAFARALPVCQEPRSRNRLFTSRQQINLLTSFIDGSMIYGSEVELSERLRNPNDNSSLLLTTKRLLPIDPTITNCNVRGNCSLVGDERGDENIPLHTMHTVWAREHNRIAGLLREFAAAKGIFPTNERLYQVARKINIAVLQNIVFDEWLPNVVTLPEYRRYRPVVNPTVSNAFATAAFRFGHSLIPNKFSQLDKFFNPISEPIKLQDVFNRNDIIRGAPGVQAQGIEPTMFGLLGNRSNNVDNGFAFGISRRLFVGRNEERRVDLTAYNIKRGRDHGLPTYGRVRRHCRLNRINNFTELKNFVIKGTSTIFANLYNSVDDIDLFAAGISEVNQPGKLVGETFACLIEDQFRRLRDGDRFFYRATGMFNDAQLKAIEKITMASVLCQNLNGAQKIQEKAFRVTSNINPRILCRNHPFLDLNLFVNDLIESSK